MLSSIKLDYYGFNSVITNVKYKYTRFTNNFYQPFDKSLMGDIEKAIIEANLGINPMNNGDLIMINVPSLTEERRIDLVKQVKSETENLR